MAVCAHRQRLACCALAFLQMAQVQRDPRPQGWYCMGAFLAFFAVADPEADPSADADSSAASADLFPGPFPSSPAAQ